MINVKDVSWVKKDEYDKTHICTLCESINGECIVERLGIVDNEGSEIDCSSSRYGRMDSYPVV